MIDINLNISIKKFRIMNKIKAIKLNKTLKKLMWKIKMNSHKICLE